MVTATQGILSSANAGDGTTSTIANRVLVDFKDALQTTGRHLWMYCLCFVRIWKQTQVGTLI